MDTAAFGHLRRVLLHHSEVEPLECFETTSFDQVAVGHQSHRSVAYLNAHFVLVQAVGVGSPDAVDASFEHIGELAAGPPKYGEECSAAVVDVGAGPEIVEGEVGTPE